MAKGREVLRLLFMVFVGDFQNALYGFLFENDLAVLENQFKEISILLVFLCKIFKKIINTVVKKLLSSTRLGLNRPLVFQNLDLVFFLKTFRQKLKTKYCNNIPIVRP